MSDQTPITGRNGVAIRGSKTSGDGFRTYEVFQRERVGQSTEKIKPAQLNSDAYRSDPYPLLAILREHYPCYRDWLNNCFWITRYDDVTSLFADDANFETRSKAWFYGLYEAGRDFSVTVPVLQVIAETWDREVSGMAGELLATMQQQGGGNLATEFAATLATNLTAAAFGVPRDDWAEFAGRYWRLQRGTSWQPQLQQDGLQAYAELVTYFEALPISGGVAGALQDSGESPTPEDIVVTLLEQDHETLHGLLANLWCRLLSDHSAREAVGSDARLMKLAVLETWRHSTPTISAKRFARHEVERFGRLLPAGALMVCSAAAANRDPRVFANPDEFVVDRADLCQREPRGQYRADGLASGISFGTGKPSIHPAIPEDRPRSRYALVRDTAVAASLAVLEAMPHVALAAEAKPGLHALTTGEMHTCWQLPITC